MIAEIGLYALVLAALTSLLQGTVPMIGAARRRARRELTARGLDRKR